MTHIELLGTPGNKTKQNTFGDGRPPGFWCFVKAVTLSSKLFSLLMPVLNSH